MRRTIILIALGLTAAACSGSSDPTTTTGGTTPDTSTTVPAPTTSTDPPPTTTVTTVPPPTTTTSTIPPPDDLVATDVAADVGIDASFRTLGLAVGDVNGNGSPDMVVLRRRGGTALLLYRSKDGVFGNANFPAEPGVARSSCDWGDVQADGLADLYCTVSDGANELWVQREDGSFADEAEAFGVAEADDSSVAARFVRANDDEFPDLVVANRADADDPERRSRLFINEGGESFAADANFDEHARLVRGGCLDVADLDGDGIDEVLECTARLVVIKATADGYAEIGSRLGFLRRGDGERWEAVAAGDANDDGNLDVALVSGSEVAVHLQEEDRFEKVAFSMEIEDGRDVAFADANGDGFDDVYVLQRGCGGLAAPPADGEAPPNAADLLLAGNGSGGFGEVPMDQADEGCGDRVAAADVDGDGSFEFIVLNGYRSFNGPIQVIATAAG